MTLTIGQTTYRVELTGRPQAPYMVYGPRGAIYGLLRNRRDPSLLFSVNLRQWKTHSPLGWFTDRDGELRRVV